MSTRSIGSGSTITSHARPRWVEVIANRPGSRSARYVSASSIIRRRSISSKPRSSLRSRRCGVSSSSQDHQSGQSSVVTTSRFVWPTDGAAGSPDWSGPDRLVHDGEYTRQPVVSCEWELDSKAWGHPPASQPANRASAWPTSTRPREVALGSRKPIPTPGEGKVPGHDGYEGARPGAERSQAQGAQDPGGPHENTTDGCITRGSGAVQ